MLNFVEFWVDEHWKRGRRRRSQEIPFGCRNETNGFFWFLLGAHCAVLPFVSLPYAFSDSEITKLPPLYQLHTSCSIELEDFSEENAQSLPPYDVVPGLKINSHFFYHFLFSYS